MKVIIVILLAFSMSTISSGQSQILDFLPLDTLLIDEKGNVISVWELSRNSEKPILISTWSIYECKECLLLLDYWNSETAKSDNLFELIAINIDGVNSWNEIQKFAQTRDWIFTNYKQVNSGHKSPLGNLPFMAILNEGYMTHFQNGFQKKDNVEATIENMLLGLKFVNLNVRYYHSNGDYARNKNEAFFITKIRNQGDRFEVINFWAANGAIEMKGSFEDKYMNIEDGQFTWYHFSGKKYLIRNYKRGKIIGIETYYYENGKPQTKREYDANGRLIKVYFTKDQSGKKLYSGTFQEGHGTLLNYDSDASCIQKSHYENGLLNGWRTEYDENGFVIDKILYQNGIPVPE